MENCGMRREAHYRKKVRYVKHGVPSWEDELEYAILREERQ
jgi:RimJ/RimL family protein N-acetyltransferase